MPGRTPECRYLFILFETTKPHGTGLDLATRKQTVTIILVDEASFRGSLAEALHDDGQVFGYPSATAVPAFDTLRDAEGWTVLQHAGSSASISPFPSSSRQLPQIGYAVAPRCSSAARTCPRSAPTSSD